ncbi:hypothetical protein C5C39_05745 [Rathayibacter sp. AY1F3]|uniref:hypothetical protein n=1 Tax=Rathayibacter sp. AY1F3 TaxID=2080558 RepID=UPI000CE914C6|nr:hypothetical protein [Rathayibacter sp. AY1F3]PPG91841.1 hypothetical protein C5C39_05745 [Rathayibacter sp. AY1F3]
MSTTAPPRALVTGLLVTELSAGPDGTTVWTRRLGEQAPLPFSPVPVRLAAPDPRIVPGGADPSVRRYRTTARALLPALLHELSEEALVSVGREWKGALDALHGARPAGEPLPPRPLQRARGWLAGGWAPAAEELGAGGLLELADWAEAVVASPAAVVVHGHPGLAHLVVGGTRVALLTGEDVGLADPVWDAAWVLGELAELHAFHPALRPALDALRRGLSLEEDHDAELLRVGTAFRLAQHAVDWHRSGGASSDQARLLLSLSAAQLGERAE